jgi:hypothetical protein
MTDFNVKIFWAGNLTAKEVFHWLGIDPEYREPDPVEGPLGGFGRIGRISICEYNWKKHPHPTTHLSGKWSGVLRFDTSQSVWVETMYLIMTTIVSQFIDDREGRKFYIRGEHSCLDCSGGKTRITPAFSEMLPKAALVNWLNELEIGPLEEWIYPDDWEP